MRLEIRPWILIKRREARVCISVMTAEQSIMEILDIVQNAAER